MHDPNYNDNDRTTPLTEITLVLEDRKEVVIKCCSICLSNYMANKGEYDELCSCAHAKIFHNLQLDEKQKQNIALILEEKKQRQKKGKVGGRFLVLLRDNICEGGGVDPLKPTKEGYDGYACWDNYCRCKTFRPTRIRLPERKSDSGSIPS